MTAHWMPRAVRRAGAVTIVAMVLGGCSQSQDAEPVADADQAVERSVITDVEVTVASLADPSLNPEGVIFAAIVLATGGDVDGAMADGMFTRADLDAARAGVADGSLEYLFD